MFTIQMESEQVNPQQQTSNSPSPTRSPIKRKQKSLLSRNSTLSSKHSKSRISESMNLSRRAQLRSVWTHNDFTVCNIIA